MKVKGKDGERETLGDGKSDCLVCNVPRSSTPFPNLFEALSPT